MGFWDVRLADLEAAGETFTDDEVRVLEEGGKVLHLHPLETPDVETYDWCLYPDGDVVLLPEICEIYAPNDPLPPRYQPTDKKKGLVTAADYLDLNHDWRGNGREGRKLWTWAPHYVGDVDTMHDVCGIRCEECSAYAYWNCWPITTPHQMRIAEQVVQAGGEMLDRGLYHQMQWVCMDWYSGDGPDPADYWLYVNHRDRLKQEDIDVLESHLMYDHGSHDWEVQAAYRAADVQQMLDARLLSLYGEFVDLDPHAGEENLPMPLPRLETLLDERQQYEAADLVRRMLARRRASLARLPSPTNYRGYTENEVTD